jgi:hypothetical protein
LFSKVTVNGLDLDVRGSILYRDIDSSQQGVPRTFFLEGGGGGGSGVNRNLICHTQSLAKLPMDAALYELRAQ